jgi:hypothetical protein
VCGVPIRGGRGIADDAVVISKSVALAAARAAATLVRIARRGDHRRCAAERQALAEASSPAFDVFHVGPEFEGLAMTEAVRQHVATDPEFPQLGRRDDVTYLYGECPREQGAAARVEARAPRWLPTCVGGCVPPLEVSSSPLCQKHVGLYLDPDVGAWEYESRSIKGVPAASFDGGRILEIYTANTTITIYGQDPELVLRAAVALRPAAATNLPRGIQPLHM